MSSTLKKGLVQVYTGNGKGKTTAALGLALRASGHGMKTFVCQFMKGYEYGEVRSAKKLGDLVRIEQFGGEACIPLKDKPDQVDVDRAGSGMQRAREVLDSGDYDIVILDEILCAVHFSLVDEGDVLDLIDRPRGNTELILTGRWAGDAVIEKADLVSEVKEIKHYFTQGIQARDGIER